MKLCSKKLRQRVPRGVYKRNVNALIWDTFRNHKIFTSAKREVCFHNFTALADIEQHYLSSYEEEEK